jgi:Rhs element Vgr protein
VNGINQSRTLPIPIEHRAFTVFANGEEVPRAQHLLAVSVSTVIDRIAYARLAYQDGAPAESDFRFSNATTLAPGAEVEIRAGSGDEQHTLFKGIVTRLELKAREGSAPQLIVHCRHRAMKMTVGRKSAYFFDATDSDVLAQLFQQAGIEAEVADSRVRHEQLVQYDATDWDFCLLRAQANGLSLITRGDRVLVQKPTLDGAAAIDLQFGATVLEMDLRLEARDQFKSVTSVTWDKADQALAEAEAEDPGFTSPGNLGPQQLAGVVGLDGVVARHPELASPEAQGWSDALWRRSQLNRVVGRVKCAGIGSIQAGDRVSLGGVGDRFSGQALVTGVRHDFDLVQGWKTHLQVGGVETPEPDGAAMSAPKASGLLPGVNGLHVGVVVSNEDPANEFRVRVAMPMVNPGDEGAWARVACLDAGADRGFFIRPEVGDEVILGFLNDDPRHAVVLGMLNSSAKPAPLQGSNDNHLKVFQTRSGKKWSFDDQRKSLKFETPAGNLLALDESDGSIVLKDQHGNEIRMDASGIAIQSQNALALKAAANLNLEAGGSLHGTGGADVKLEGASGAELTSNAIARLRGSLVQIN